MTLRFVSVRRKLKQQISVTSLAKDKYILDPTTVIMLQLTLFQKKLCFTKTKNISLVSSLHLWNLQCFYFKLQRLVLIYWYFPFLLFKSSFIYQPSLSNNAKTMYDLKSNSYTSYFVKYWSNNGKLKTNNVTEKLVDVYFSTERMQVNNRQIS